MVNGGVARVRSLIQFLHKQASSSGYFRLHTGRQSLQLSLIRIAKMNHLLKKIKKPLQVMHMS